MRIVRQSRRVRRENIKFSGPYAGPMPKTLPIEATSYQPLYNLMLKHSAHRGIIQGNLVEIGPGITYWFMKFLLESPAAKQDMLSVCAYQPVAEQSHIRNIYPLEVGSRIVPTSIVDAMQSHYTRGQTNIIVAKSLFDSPDVGPYPKKKSAIFKAMSYIAAPGAKAYIQTAEPTQSISREEIKQQGWKIIDALNRPSREIFILVLKKNR